MINQSAPGTEPVSPSRDKLSDRQFTGAVTAQPTDRGQGVDVSKYRSVILSVHPVNPDINDAGAVGWVLQVKVWRWKLNARWGTGRPGGQWYASELLTISMDGDVANGGPMEYPLPTWDSEEMFFQPVVTNLPAGIEAISVYGDVPRQADGSCACTGGDPSGQGTTPVVIANLFDLLAHEDNCYSTLRGDFSAVRTSGTTITLSDLDFAITEEQVLAVGLKRAGATSAMQMWYRDHDLLCDWTPGSSLLTISGFAINALDTVHVWIEGPSKTNDPTNRARRAKVVNPDSYHVATDGLFVDAVFEAQDPTRYFPFMMGQDGYHWLSSAFTLTDDCRVTLEATNDLERDSGEVWYDVTMEVLGVGAITTANDARTYPPQCWVGWRRLRWVVSEALDGGTAKIYMFRSAYGDNWVPVARDGEPAIPPGIHALAEAVAVQPAAEDAADAARLITDLYHGLILSNYIYANQANRTEEADPLDTRDIGEKFEESDIDANTVFDYYIDMAHYTDLTLQLAVWAPGAGTIAITVEFSDQDDGTAPNACVYVDTSLRRYGATPILAAVGLAESIGDAAAGAPNPAVPNINMKWAHIEVTVAGDPTDAAFELWTRRLWR